jgi:putative intracellular protease/amidase
MTSFRLRLFIAVAASVLTVAPPAAAQDVPSRKKVAVLIYDGAEVIDYAGPYEVFGGDPGSFDLYTVAPREAPITTGMGRGMKVTADYSFANAPQADVLIIPGGMIGKVEHDPAVLDWIKSQSAHTQITMSVCNGAFILANTGALAGLTATTTRVNIDALRKEHPEIKVVRDQRFVDNGHYITTGGVSAGIDGALHVQRRLLGPGYAQGNALYLEYQAHGARDYLPATFAVNVIPQPAPAMGKLGDWSLISTDGNTQHWNQVADVRTQLNPAELRRALDAAYSTAGHWRRLAGDHAGRSRWAFVDADGQRWTSVMALGPSPDGAGKYRFTLAVSQAKGPK